MTEVSHDYSQYEEKSKDSLKEHIKTLTNLAEQQRELEVEIAKDEDKLNAKRERLKTLSESTIPTLMDELGMEQFKTKSGLLIKVGEQIRASIPKARATEALKWLENNGFDKLIKREFIIQFTREQVAWANKFQADCNKRKKPLDLTRKEGVHNKTLVSFVKERLETGDKNFPQDLFGVFRQRVSKIDVKA